MSEHTKGTYMTVTQIMAECAALHRELAAARALLREVSGATIGELQRLMPTIRSYLDACDTLGGNSEVGS